MRYDPWLDAARRYGDIHIEWHAIKPMHALWVPGTDIILVDENCTQVERRCGLAHEIAHMDANDRPTSMCWFHTRQENRADILAAERLVDAHELADILRWSSETPEICQMLGVTRAVLALRWRTMPAWERAPIEAVLSQREVVA